MTATILHRLYARYALDGITRRKITPFLSGIGRSVYSPSGVDGRGAPAVTPRASKAAIKTPDRTILTRPYVVVVLSVECLGSGAE